jgi:hypothetical protein
MQIAGKVLLNERLKNEFQINKAPQRQRGFFLLKKITDVYSQEVTHLSPNKLND